ncbi:phage scaffold protein [Caproiciproducens sp. NJN-50]|uniref:phage scaffolding protein n=1 Tax=Caproiciproducens sp. NJN-50 TaxID=2507162 RepID=UPI000FFE2EF0|nr:phage scaffolding protein [Caproiciproducens sp. NJN-50]QAT48582.1 phage scaffold protein [Caproiciproducens sp. NJN-50]
MLEWLKTILGDTYTEDIDKKVSTEIGKGFVSRTDFNTANEAKKTLEGQIADRDKQIKGFEKLAGDNEALKTQLTQAQEANKTAKTDYEANLKKVTLDSKVETALLGAKAKSTKAVRALLDESKISIDGDNVLGLNEQLEALKKDSAYLFGDAQTQNPPPPVKGDPPKTGDNDMAQWAKEAGVKLPKT